MAATSKHCRLSLRESTLLSRSERRLSRRTRRRGSLYVAVLGVTTIVAMMALAAMHVVRLNLKAATSRNERYEAVVLASSAVENGLIVLENDANWRTSLQSGAEYPSTPVTFGGGTFTWKLVDADGNLADDLSDTVLLQGIGRVGGVTHVEQVRLQPIDAGLTCLEASLHCQGSVFAIFGPDLVTNQMASSNQHISFSFDSDLTGDAEAVGTISGSVSGSETTGITPRQMPGSDAFDYYINMGTLIDINLLPVGPSYRSLEKVLLSPQSNPYGTPNPEGIYVLDCLGGELRVRDLRVLGTLVLLNPAASSRIEHEVHFEPAIANFPSLLVKGNIQVRNDTWNQLNESAEGVNFNPPGSPYQGTEDSDTSDIYPNLIKGLVYVSGILDLPQDWAPSTIDGVVVCGSISFGSDLNLTYRSWFLDYPPPGFAAGSTMRISPGSWVRAPSP